MTPREKVRFLIHYQEQLLVVLKSVGLNFILCPDNTLVHTLRVFLAPSVAQGVTLSVRLSVRPAQSAIKVSQSSYISLRSF